MKKYYFWDDQGRFAGAYELPEGEEVHPNSTEIAPPELTERYKAMWAGDCWIINLA